jgi:hypothetical protein
VFLVEDSVGPIDVVAWQPQAQRIGSWRGLAWGLGQDRAYDARIGHDDALPVWRSPLDWLRADRRGIVILRPGLAGHFLDDAGPLLAEDPEHGRELKRALARPGPRILVRASNLRRAA